jgi:hypothetical protein
MGSCEDRGESSCAGCRRTVTGRDGDTKVYIGHLSIVLCRACFQRHPSLPDWLGSDLASARARRMVRDRDVVEPRAAAAGTRWRR